MEAKNGHACIFFFRPVSWDHKLVISLSQDKDYKD